MAFDGAAKHKNPFFKLNIQLIFEYAKYGLLLCLRFTLVLDYLCRFRSSWIKWWQRKEFSAIICSLSLSSFLSLFGVHNIIFVTNNFVIYHHRSKQGINWRLSGIIRSLKHLYGTFHSRFRDSPLAIRHLKKGNIKNVCDTLTPFVICTPHHKNKRIQLSAN